MGEERITCGMLHGIPIELETTRKQRKNDKTQQHNHNKTTSEIHTHTQTQPRTHRNTKKHTHTQKHTQAHTDTHRKGCPGQPTTRRGSAPLPESTATTLGRTGTMAVDRHTQTHKKPQTDTHTHKTKKKQTRHTNTHTNKIFTGCRVLQPSCTHTPGPYMLSPPGVI